MKLQGQLRKPKKTQNVENEKRGKAWCGAMKKRSDHTAQYKYSEEATGNKATIIVLRKKLVTTVVSAETATRHSNRKRRLFMQILLIFSCVWPTMGWVQKLKNLILEKKWGSQKAEKISSTVPHRNLAWKKIPNNSFYFHTRKNLL